jgi:hypothetical protein
MSSFRAFLFGINAPEHSHVWWWPMEVESSAKIANKKAGALLRLCRRTAQHLHRQRLRAICVMANRAGNIPPRGLGSAHLSRPAPGRRRSPRPAGRPRADNMAALGGASLQPAMQADLMAMCLDNVARDALARGRLRRRRPVRVQRDGARLGRAPESGQVLPRRRYKSKVFGQA